jgi:hypothetical protein
MKNVGNGFIVSGAVLVTTGIVLSRVKEIDASNYFEYCNQYGQVLYYEYQGNKYNTKKELDGAITKEREKVFIWTMVGGIGYGAMVAGIPIRIVGRVKAAEWKSKFPSAYIVPNGLNLVWRF